MQMKRRLRTAFALLVAGPLLAGCAMQAQWDADGPRNGAGERVDPVTGIVLPGVQQGGGGAT
jgi:hypothetical protein